ncbi:MAG: AsmA family protein [Victivallales bacterium]
MKKLRITVIFLTLIVVTGISVRIALPTVLVAIANKQLSKYLASPAKLKTVHLGLLDGRVTVQGLTVRQPDGFGDDLLLDLPEAKVKLSVRSLFSSPLTVDEVMVKDLTVHLIRDKDGKVNVTCLLRPLKGKPATTVSQKPIYVRKITAKNLTIQYTDFALSKEPLDIKINQFGAVITDVYLYPDRSHEQSLPGRAEATARIVQPGFSDAPMGIIARFGYFYSDQSIPAVNAAIRLAGLELQTLHAVATQGAAPAIGGDIMDFNADVSMAPEVFNCTLAIVTPAGNSLSLTLGGTPRQPLVDKGSISGILGDRTGEAGLNALKNIADTGEELRRTAVSSVTVFGAGADKMLTGIATGLFRVATRVSEGKMSEAGANLRETTLESLSNTREMVGTTGASLSDGAMKTGVVAVGNDCAREWRADIQRRWTRNWEAACKSVQQKPFPLPAPPASE